MHGIRIDEDETVHLKLQKNFSNEPKEEDFPPLLRQDVPSDISWAVSDQAIKEYNDTLPTKEELKHYLTNFREYLRIKENGNPITFYVNNLGTAKATDVSVTIEFPDLVRVLEVDNAIEMDEPNAPKTGENPIITAYRKAGQVSSYVPTRLNVMKPWISWDSADISPLFKNGNTINSSMEIKDNIVEIEQKQGIVHTKFASFYGAYIVPLSTGIYEAKVTLMCAEYEDPVEKTIKFIVEN